MSGELQGLAYEVHHPTKYLFAGVEAAVAASYLLDGAGLLGLPFSVQGLRDHAVNGVQQEVAHHIHAALASLPNLDEIVDEDVGVPHRSLERSVRGRRHVVGLWFEHSDTRYGS